MRIAVAPHTDVEAPSLQRDRIGAFHIQFGETAFLQLLWEKLVLPVVESVRADLVLLAPLFNGATALALLFNKVFPFELFVFW